MKWRNRYSARLGCRLFDPKTLGIYGPQASPSRMRVSVQQALQIGIGKYSDALKLGR